jgi:hypothetical protein
MVEVRFYGKLRRYAPDPTPSRESLLRLEPQPDETVRGLLARLGVPLEEISHVFLNGALLLTCNSMAPWLRYPRPVDRGEGLDAPLRPGDRLGLFGRDMAMLVV